MVDAFAFCLHAIGKCYVRRRDASQVEWELRIFGGKSAENTLYTLFMWYRKSISLEVDTGRSIKNELGKCTLTKTNIL